MGRGAPPGAPLGAFVGAFTRIRPARVHHRYSQQLVVVAVGVGAAPTRTIELVCPAGLGAGEVMELDFEGAPYFVSIPDGVAPGTRFRVELELAPTPTVATAPPLPPPACPPPPAAIISDNHGDWTTQRFDGGIAEALPRWKALPFHYASVLFARRPVDGQWVVEKSFGMGHAVARIEERFRGEFARAMFPLHAVALPVPLPPPPPVPSAPPMLEFEGSPPPYAGEFTEPAPPGHAHQVVRRAEGAAPPF